MLLHLSTWQEIEANLRTSRAIVIPIGSTEQHGPTGLLGTDFLCPEIIAHEAARRGELLIAPTFNVGMAQHHLGFPGSISLRPSTFIAALGDWTRSLTGHGFERLYFLNGHGGNVATIEAAFSEIYSAASFERRSAGFALKLRNWWDLPGVMGIANRLFPTGHGVHATPSEIAVTQWGLSGRHQGRQLRPPDRAQRPHPRSGRLPRPLPRWPHGLGPQSGQPREGPRAGRAGGARVDQGRGGVRE